MDQDKEEILSSSSSDDFQMDHEITNDDKEDISFNLEKSFNKIKKFKEKLRR